MSEERKDTGEKLPDEALKEATGGSSEVTKTITCPKCQFTQTFTAATWVAMQLSVHCPNCGCNWIEASARPSAF